ncbi:MAG TPA: MoaD/ThiS family protein [Anaerolineaceae bacterium]
MTETRASTPGPDGELTVSVEVSGLARSIAGARRVDVDLPRGADFHTLVRRLADLFPGLVDLVIAPGREDLLNANVFTRNDEIVMPDLLDSCLEDGDRLALLSIIVGGSTAP